MSSLPLDQIATDWAAALGPVRSTLDRIDAALTAERAAGREVLPASTDVLRAFRLPMARVRVLLVGQDPYPTPGHAVGLAFSVAPGVRPVPRSLANVLRELSDDLGCAPRTDGDLSDWEDQGVLLLNRVLTVGQDGPGSHTRLGWQEVTACAVRALAARGGPLVAVLWGRQAQELLPLLPGVPVVASAHPSPLSAARGFFGSRPFSRVNALLAEQGESPVRWCG
ncbi:uracil-DNA glycosylase [Actinotalea sp.]|uniref:uracil-DNA glycosylase n=1 Tax=Actinotalea sp. TaxID=1872145 RepID=UPI003565C090